MFHQNFCKRCDAWEGSLLWWSCLSPIAVDFWIIPIVSAEECPSLTQNLMQIHCSTHSVILNANVTQYTCSLNGIYHPHWLVQWSKWSLFMHVHSSPLSLAARLHQCCENCSCYINSGWTSSGQTSYTHETITTVYATNIFISSKGFLQLSLLFFVI